MRAMIPIINSNVISSMKVLIEQGEHMGLVDESISSDASVIKALGDDAAIDSTLASVLEELWNSGTIQQVFEQRHKFQLPDCLLVFARTPHLNGLSATRP